MTPYSRGGRDCRACLGLGRASLGPRTRAGRAGTRSPLRECPAFSLTASTHGAGAAHQRPTPTSCSRALVGAAQAPSLGSCDGYCAGMRVQALASLYLAGRVAIGPCLELSLLRAVCLTTDCMLLKQLCMNQHERVIEGALKVCRCTPVRPHGRCRRGVLSCESKFRKFKRFEADLEAPCTDASLAGPISRAHPHIARAKQLDFVRSVAKAVRGESLRARHQLQGVTGSNHEHVDRWRAPLSGPS